MEGGRRGWIARDRRTAATINSSTSTSLTISTNQDSTDQQQTATTAMSRLSARHHPSPRLAPTRTTTMATTLLLPRRSRLSSTTPLKHKLKSLQTPTLFPALLLPWGIARLPSLPRLTPFLECYHLHHTTLTPSHHQRDTRTPTLNHCRREARLRCSQEGGKVLSTRCSNSKARHLRSSSNNLRHLQRLTRRFTEGGFSEVVLCSLTDSSVTRGRRLVIIQ